MVDLSTLPLKGKRQAGTLIIPPAITHRLIRQAGVVKLVDTLDLGSSASRRGGSSPFTRTKPQRTLGFFYGMILPNNSP